MKTSPLRILFLLIALKILVSLLFITSFPIDLDEPFSLFNAQSDWSDLIQLFAKENNPPLHFILLHWWEKLFGIHPFAVRSLSLVFSVFTLPVLWYTFQRFLSQRNLIILCILVIFSNFHFYHGIEARTYSLLVFEYALLLNVLVRLVFDRDLSLKHFIFLGLINAAIFYTHYLFFFIAIGELAVALWFFRSWQLWKRLTLSMGIFLLLIAPWWQVLATRVDSINTTGTWISEALFMELIGFINQFLNGKIALPALIVLGAVLLFKRNAFTWGRLAAQPQLLIFLILSFLIPYLAVFIVSKYTIVHLFLDRYLFFLSIPLFVLVALFFDHRDRFVTIALYVFLAIFMLRFSAPRKGNNRDGDALANYAKSTGIKTIVIAPDYYDLTFIYHFNQALFKRTDLRAIENKHGIFPLKDRTVLDEMYHHRQFIYIDADYAFTRPEDTSLYWLKTHFHLVSVKAFKGGYKVYRFATLMR